MKSSKKSWKEKLHCGASSEVKPLGKAFSGYKAGDRMLIPTPMMVDEYIQAIPKGEVRTLKQMRDDLAAVHGADLTCPLCAGIFTRICAEAANEALEMGAQPESVTPYWRVLEPKGSLRQKASFDLSFADAMLAAEA
jgi:alkylated DNA nucleotide flippase Atl1